MSLTHQQVRSQSFFRNVTPHFLISPSVASYTSLQFIDLCILLGCDYCGTIKGIGPKKAIDLIRQHGSIEEILDNIDQSVSYLPPWGAGVGWGSSVAVRWRWDWAALAWNPQVTF